MCVYTFLTQILFVSYFMWVCTIGGGYAEYVNVDQRHVMSIPKSLSMTEAGGVPEVWLTAYQLLHHIGMYLLHVVLCFPRLSHHVFKLAAEFRNISWLDVFRLKLV